jgi:hypothetical protein
MTRIKKPLIFVLIISMLLGNVAIAADISAVTVSTYQELKKALEPLAQISLYPRHSGQILQ